MSAKDVANALVSLCKEGKNDEIVATYYADDVVSVEASTMDGSPREVTGLDAIKEKHKFWYDTFETLGMELRGPFMHGDDQFAVYFSFKVKNKMSGEEMDMEEVAVYTIKDDKIVHEAFYYTM